MLFHLLNVNKLLFVLLLVNTIVTAQDSNRDKEVIIIERTIDQDGNVVSKTIKRNQGKYTEEHLNDLIEGEGPMLRSFDMEGMGFGDLDGLFGSMGARDAKPSLGVYVSIDNGQAIITEVVSRSGAADADIRAGDKLISIEKIPVATIDDISEVIAGKKAGDEVVVVVWRDGSEIEKIVRLGGGAQGGFGSLFDGSNNPMLGFFGDDGSMRMNLDSMMRQLQGIDMEMFDFDGGGMEGLFDSNGLREREPLKEDARPQLGVFIEDRDGSIIVTEVISDSPADRAGLRVGDSIERIDDNRVASFRELKSWMNTKSIGDETVLTISRKGKESEKKLILE